MPPKPLYFYAATNNVHIGVDNLRYFYGLQYTTDLNSDWTDFPSEGVSLTKGESLYLKGKGTSEDIRFRTFTTSDSVECHGDCRSLLTYDDFTNADLRDYCFYGLFYNSRITTAPELPATTLANYCYSGMFNACTKLSTVKCNAKYVNDGNEITTKIDYGWLDGVSSQGTFYKNPNWNGPTERSGDTIPDGWVIKDWTNAPQSV